MDGRITAEPSLGLPIVLSVSAGSDFNVIRPATFRGRYLIIYQLFANRRTSGALQKSFKLGQLSAHRSVQHVGPSSRLHITYWVYHRAPTLRVIQGAAVDLVEPRLTCGYAPPIKIAEEASLTIMDRFDSTARHISGALRLAGVRSYEGARWAIPSIWRSPITPRTEGNMSAKIDHIHVVLPAAGGRSDERLTIGRTAELDHDAAPHPPPPAVRRRTRPSRRPARPARTCTRFQGAA